MAVKRELRLALAAALCAIALGAGSMAAAAGRGAGPETKLISGPASPRYEPEGTFRFTAPGSADARFECRLDRGPWRACSSPAEIRLGHGSHLFEVRAIATGGAADPTPAATRVRVVPQRVVFGRSVDGRRLVAKRIGDPAARRKALVVGQIHGDEPEGREIVDRLRRSYETVSGVELWTVSSVNPDGDARGQRKNAHGVDLNRNFSVGWRDAEPPGSGYYGGPRPFSEPESRAVRDLARRLRPRISIYYHQPWNRVLVPCHGAAPVQERYARISGMKTSCRGAGLPGTAIDWQNRKLPGLAFVVELAQGELSAAKARRHARAAVAVAKGAR